MRTPQFSDWPLHVAPARSEEERLELCEWVEFHGIDPGSVSAIQDGPVTAIEVYDEPRRLVTEKTDPRFHESRWQGKLEPDRVATSWVVVCPLLPMP